MTVDDISERAQRLVTAVTSVAATASSPDGLVSVTIGPGGEIRDVALSAMAPRRYRAEALGQTVAAVLRDGHAELVRQLTARSREILPEHMSDTPVVTGVGALPEDAAERAVGSVEPDSDAVPTMPEIPPDWVDRPGADEAARAASEWEDTQATAARYARAYQEMQRRVADAEIRVQSPDEQVAVTLRGGQLADVDVSESALRADVRILAAQIRDTVSQAQAAWAARLADEVHEAVAPMIDVHRLVDTHRAEQERR